MSEQDGKGRAKRWTEAEAGEALREFRESGLGATAFAAKKGISPKRLSYWAERLGTRPTNDVDFVTVSLPSRPVVQVEHQGVTVRLSGGDIESVAQLVVAIAHRARGC